jgi:TIGR03009 family protein
MRYHWALVCLLLESAAALAQQPPAPPATPALDPNNQLDMILVNWEKSMSSVDKLVAEIVRTDKPDPRYQTTKVFEGAAKFMRPNRASMYLVRKGRPEEFEKYLYTGNYLYQYIPAQKEIRVYPAPTPKSGQVSDDTFLSFVLPGMKAIGAKDRYQLTLMPGPPNDTWYYYILIVPKKDADKAEFTKARLVINRSNYMPRELWFQEPNGAESKWDFPRIQINQGLAVTEFATPTPPPGWRLVTVQPQPQPRLYRPQQ